MNTHTYTHTLHTHYRDNFPVAVKDNDKVQFPSANDSQMMKVNVFCV